MPLDELIADIECASSIDELKDHLQRVAEHYDFAAYNFIDAGKPHLDLPFFLGTTGKAWETEYIDNQFIRVDPVMYRARRTNVPFTWSDIVLPRSPGPRTGAQKTFEAANDHGFKDGLVVPFHFRDTLGRLHSCCTCFFWRNAAQQLKFQLAGRKRELHLIMICWAQRAVDLIGQKRSDGSLSKPAVESSVAPLSDRERAVLSWAARGKTSADTSDILGIAEETVEYFHKQILRKLNATNRTHAVAKAIHLGLIDV